MYKSNLIHILGAAIVLATLAVPMHEASAMTVQPVVVDLQTSGRGMKQVVSVINESTASLPVELQVRELILNADGTQTTGADPGDLAVFPPQALIASGQTQTFRIQYVGDPGLTRSKHYHITVAQLPVKVAEGQKQIQILYNFVVLASVGPAAAKPVLRVVSASVGKNDDGKPVPAFVLANDSTTYGYLSHGHLRIVESDPAGHEVFRQTLTGAELQQSVGMGLVASGQQRQFVLPLVLPSDGGTLVAQFTAGN